MKPFLKYIPLLSLVFITLWLRLANLGYSDYVADEVLALVILKPGQSLIEFILEQPRGPFQYLVTFLIGLVQPGYSNQLLARLPSAMAGILGIYFFYRLVQRLFGDRAALYAALLLTTNGLLVGLHRVVQYQAFTLLFSILALYAFTLALQEERWKTGGLYAGMFFWALAMLSHYDGIFIAPMAAYLLICWFQKNRDLSISTRLRPVLLSSGAAALVVAAIYAPLILGVWGEMQSYWSERFTDVLQTSQPSSSLVIFQLYNPLLAIYVYPLFGALSLLNLKRSFPAWLWFLFPWLVMEVMIYDPGTHIYNYIVPAAVIMGLGVAELEDRLPKTVRFLAPAGLGLAVLFFAGISHFVFVDHTPEYPREPRRILAWRLEEPRTGHRLWLYGFPYSRQWEDVAAYIASHEPNGYYMTNEDKDIGGFYLPYVFDLERSEYYVHIYRPQSFRDRLSSNEKIQYWMKNYPPEKIFEVLGRPMAEIYRMPAGSLAQLQAAGY